MNKKTKRIILMIFAIILCYLSIPLPLLVNATKHIEINQLETEYDDSYSGFYLKPTISSPIVIIDTPVRVSFDNTDVLSYSIETEGLTATEVTSGSMEYDIVATDEYGVLDVYATYADDVVVQSSVYTYRNENNVYISEYSNKNALEMYLESAIENNIYTLEEAENIWTGYDFQNEDIEGNIIDPDIETDGFLSFDKGTVCGTLEWKDDDGVSHPIQNAMVGIYKKYLGQNIRIATTYTDISGYFSISILPRENIYIGVFAGDDNVKVKSGILELPYRYIYSDNLYDISSNSTTVVNLAPVDMSADEGQAIQISQAVLVARNYAEFMMGEEPDNIRIIYPSDDCCYERNKEVIYITKLRKSNHARISSYASWDMIMHEYGHHIQQMIDNSNSPTNMEHDPFYNDADINDNKDIGVRLSWGESWPTVFALLAQQFYSPSLQNIETVGDTLYTSYNGDNYNLEDDLVARGEACERSIMAVLWDIYDSTYELGDNVILGHQAFWDLSTMAGTYTFSDFINNFYNEYPEYQYSIATILSKYNMATTKPTVSNLESISVNIPATINWVAQGGSYTYLNNRFSIIVYYGDEIIFRKDNITTNTYTFSTNEWQVIFLNDEYACEEEISIDIAVVAYQDDVESYTTGPYYSELQTITIEHNSNYEALNENYHSYICDDCGRTVNSEHDFQYINNGSDESHSSICVECGYTINADHTYEPYNSCYEKCTTCGYKHQIAEHDYTDHYVANVDNTEKHYSYCECGAMIEENHTTQIVVGEQITLDVCVLCGYNQSHEHYYTYTSNKDGETHMARCACGSSKIEQCFGPVQSGTLSRCVKCKQVLKIGIAPFSNEEVLLPLNKEDDVEETTE